MICVVDFGWFALGCCLRGVCCVSLIWWCLGWVGFVLRVWPFSFDCYFVSADCLVFGLVCWFCFGCGALLVELVVVVVVLWLCVIA